MKKVFTFFLLSIATLKAHPDVDMREGAFKISQTDLKIQTGKNETWEVRRAYNSRSTNIGYFGLGWCSELDKQLIVVDQEHIILKNCFENTVSHYIPSLRFPTAVPPAVLVSDGDSVSSIARISNGYLRRLASFMTETYDLSGQLTSYSLSPGREVKIVRSDQGHPLRLILPGGITVRLEIQNGRIASIVGPLGLKVRYTFEGPLLKRVTLPTGDEVKLSFDEGNNLISVEGPNKDNIIKISYDLEQDKAIKFERDSLPKKLNPVKSNTSAVSIAPEILEGAVIED